MHGDTAMTRKMVANDRSRTLLWNALRAVADGAGDEHALAQQLRTAFLAHCSETPDNLACMERIAVGTSTDDEGGTVQGPILSHSGESLAEIAWSLEDLSMPDELRADHPGMTEEDWAAFTRLTTVLFTALTCRTA